MSSAAPSSPLTSEPAKMPTFAVLTTSGSS
jgi:hypothetical protein